MPFALYSGIIVATIRAPCGDCNSDNSSAKTIQFSLQFAPLAGTVTQLLLIICVYSVLATIRAPCGDCNT